MEIDYNNLDLRNSTFLDYTDDVELIDLLISDKDFFLSHISEHSRAFSWIDFAELSEDQKLIEMVEKEFKELFDAFFNE